MTPPADSISSPPLPPTNPNLGRGRFVDRLAPALRWSRAQRRRVWITVVLGLYLGWTLLFAFIRADELRRPASMSTVSVALLILPDALRYALFVTVPILLIFFDMYWLSFAARVRHAMARRGLSRCCLSCRYPLPLLRPSPSDTTRICPECGLNAPDFLTYRRARLIEEPNWFFGTVLPTDRPASACVKLLTTRERAECFVRGRAFGLSWPLASILFALLPTLTVTVLVCVRRVYPPYHIDPTGLVLGIAILLLLTLYIWNNARTTFAFHRLYSPPPPTSPTNPNTSSTQ